MREQKTHHNAELEAARLLKAHLVKQWQSLPLSDQATLLIELMPEVLASDVGTSVQRALGLIEPEMMNSEDQPIPTNWVQRDDLIECRPDRAEQIRNLHQSEIAHIAEKVGDALAETYWLALEVILDKHLGDDDIDNDEETVNPEHLLER